MIFHVAVRSYSITFDQVAQKGIMQIFRNQTSSICMVLHMLKFTIFGQSKST